MTIQQARLVLPDRVVTGDLRIEDGIIAAIGPHLDPGGEVIDARGLLCLPGLIDPHVHLRDPGWTEREDMGSGTAAAVAGGVTSVLDMPNNRPSTDSVAALEAKLDRAKGASHAHYGFFVSATVDNLDEINRAERTCGVLVHMGRSQSNTSLNDPEAIEALFAQSTHLLAVHAEDQARLAERKHLYEHSHDVHDHPQIRDEECALIATRHACELAAKYGHRLHLLHVSSDAEVSHLRSVDRRLITAEVAVHHLLLSAPSAYDRLGTYAQTNPPIRSERHRLALWDALDAGQFDCVVSAHAPHTRQSKNATYPTSPSGVPGVEWTLPALMTQVQRGRMTLLQLVRWACEGPARCYGIPRKGRLEVGYDGDVVLVDPASRRTVTDEMALTRCGWGPFRGMEFSGWPVLTALLGEPVFRDGEVLQEPKGRELVYDLGQ